VRRHLGDAVAQAVIHDRDDDARDQQAAEAACVEAEVPAVEISRDDRADTERPKRPEGGVTAQLAPFEIAVFRVPIGDRSDCPALLSAMAPSLAIWRKFVQTTWTIMRPKTPTSIIRRTETVGNTLKAS
jgi:hypothetical protein